MRPFAPKVERLQQFTEDVEVIAMDARLRGGLPAYIPLKLAELSSSYCPALSSFSTKIESKNGLLESCKFDGNLIRFESLVHDSDV